MYLCRVAQGSARATTAIKLISCYHRLDRLNYQVMTDSSPLTPHDNKFMQRALQLAHEAEVADEVPVGAVLVIDNEIIGEGYNCPISTHDPSAHAEMVAMRDAASKIGNYRLIDSTLYVTLEPCIMCMGAIIHARVKRLVYAATDPKAGAVHSIYTIPDDKKLNHHVDISSGILAEESADLLKSFFQKRRK